MRIALCFPGLSADTIELVEFYRSEREILGRLGTVTVVTSGAEVPRDVDLVFSWWWDRSLPMALRCARRPAPLVITGASDIGNPVKLPLARVTLKNVAARVSASLASANLAVSDVEAARLRRWGYPKVEVVHHGVDTAFYQPVPEVTRDPFLLLTILQLNVRSVVRKGLLKTVAALAHTEDDRYRLAIVGEDQGGVSMVKRLASSLGVVDQLTFVGRASRLEKRDLLWNAGLYLQPSSYEGFGYALAEAMAAGCPVVSGSTGSLPQVTGGYAYGYADSPAELASVLVASTGDAAGRAGAAEKSLAHCRTELSYGARERRLGTLFATLL